MVRQFVTLVRHRIDRLTGLLAALASQARGQPVEVLVLLDNRQRSTGAKQNALIRQARGRYVTIVDDDDAVAETYVDDLLRALRDHPGVGCVVFDVAFYRFGRLEKIFRYGQEYGWLETDTYIFREPCPLMCWRRDILLRYPFPDQSVNEDAAWIAAGPWKHEPVTQARIPRVLYEYRAEPGHP